MCGTGFPASYCIGNYHHKYFHSVLTCNKNSQFLRKDPATLVIVWTKTKATITHATFKILPFATKTH